MLKRIIKIVAPAFLIFFVIVVMLFALEIMMLYSTNPHPFWPETLIQTFKYTMFGGDEGGRVL